MTAPMWVPSAQDHTTGKIPYRLVARFTERTWIRIRMDNGQLIQETAPAGAVRQWVSNGRFLISIGNAGAVSFELNGRPLPPLGPRGTVVSGVAVPPEGARLQ